MSIQYYRRISCFCTCNCMWVRVELLELRRGAVQCCLKLLQFRGSCSYSEKTLFREKNNPTHNFLKININIILILLIQTPIIWCIFPPICHHLIHRYFLNYRQNLKSALFCALLFISDQIACGVCHTSSFIPVSSSIITQASMGSAISLLLRFRCSSKPVPNAGFSVHESGQNTQ